MTTPRFRNRSLEIVALACLLAAVGTGAAEVDAALPLWGRIAGFAFAAAFLSLPFIVLYIFGRGLRSFLPRAMIAVGMAAALGFWLWAWYTTFVNNPRPDAQDGLAIVVVPVYSAGAALVVGLLSRILDRR